MYPICRCRNGDHDKQEPAARTVANDNEYADDAQPLHSNQRIASKTQEEANEYDKNIQVVELNALNVLLS